MTTLNEILKKDLEKYSNYDVLLNEKDLIFIKSHLDFIIKRVLRRKLLKEYKEMIEPLVKDGLCVREISQKTDIPDMKVRSICSKLKLNVNLKGNDHLKEKKMENVKMYKILAKQGLSNSEIAKKMGLSQNTIRSYFHLCWRLDQLKKTS